MLDKLAFSLAALLSLVPASVLPYRRPAGRGDPLMWLLLAVAVVGPAAYALSQVGGTWYGGFSTTLWVSVAASAALFAGLAATTRAAWRLAALLLPYLFVLGVLATVWSQAPAAPRPLGGGAWLVAHILLSVAAYALATVAAVAGAAVFLQERALKRKQPTRLTGLLPAVAEAEALLVRLLAAAGGVLGVDLLSGMAVEYVTMGRLFEFNHKTLLSVLAFVLIVALLAVHRRTGVRGRRAARIVLLAYLLLTLGFPGVKFVTDVLMA